MTDDEEFARLKAAIEADGRTPRSISMEAKLGPNYVQQMLAKGVLPKPVTMRKLLAALAPEAREQATATPSEVREANVPPPRLMHKDVPVYGTAAGSGYEKGAFQLTPDVVDYVRRPPGLLNSRDVYALYVEGDSMAPRFEAGELIYVNPNRPVRHGDYVVIQEPVSEGEIRGFVKQFVKRAGEWVVVRQFNPEAELRFPASDSVKVHKVLTVADMMGV